MEAEAKHQELINKRARVEAQIALFESELAKIKQELEDKYGIADIDELVKLITDKTDEYEKRKTKALKEQEQIMQELDNIIEAVKV